MNGSTRPVPQLAKADYDGRAPFAGGGGAPATFQGRARAAATATAAFVVVPFAGLGVAMWLAWGHGLNLADILLAAVFYVITGLGVTVGFHRLLTHRSFTAVRALRVALAVAGSMSFQGGVICWVAIHREIRILHHLVGPKLEEIPHDFAGLHVSRFGTAKDHVRIHLSGFVVHLQHRA